MQGDRPSAAMLFIDLVFLEYYDQSARRIKPCGAENMVQYHAYPDSKVHGADMGPI